MKFKTILPDSDDLPVEVEYTYYPEVRGNPCDEECIEIDLVLDHHGNEVRVSMAQERALEKECWADLRKRQKHHH